MVARARSLDRRVQRDDHHLLDDLGELLAFRVHLAVVREQRVHLGVPALEGLDDAQQLGDLAGQRVAVAQRLGLGLGNAVAHLAQELVVLALRLRQLRRAVPALARELRLLSAQFVLGGAQGARTIVDGLRMSGRIGDRARTPAAREQPGHDRGHAGPCGQSHEEFSQDATRPVRCGAGDGAMANVLVIGRRTTDAPRF